MSCDGFLTSYSHDDAESLRNSSALALTVRSTAATPYATQVLTVRRVGDRPFKRKSEWPYRPSNDKGAYYLDSYPQCQLNTSRRLRIISVQLLGEESPRAWDLDSLPSEDQQRLAHDVLDQKIVIGRYLIPTLAWLGHLTDAIPSRLIDCLLLARSDFHSVRIVPHILAADGHKSSEELISTAVNQFAFSLQGCAAAYKLPIPSLKYCEFQAWCVTHLSPAHFADCTEDLQLCVGLIARFLEFPQPITPDVITAALNGTFYSRIFEPVLPLLLDIHRRGLPISKSAINNLIVKAENEITSLVRTSLESPANTIKPVVNDFKRGVETKALHDVLLHADSSINSAFERIRTLASHIRMLERWDDHKHGGRIHPIFDLLTKTGRTSSNSPSAQNFPRDPAFRAIIKASPGTVIISADYSQAELRIAAAMAERELARAAKELNDKQQQELDPRIRRALEDARNRHERHDPPPPLIPWKYGDSHWFKAKLSELGYAYYQTLAHGRMMAAVLREKLDPHLLTAIAMTARSGKISLKGMAELEFLRQSDQQALRRELAVARQAAKGTNFGNLYGQSVARLHQDGIEAYGLSWSLQEAAAAREAWLKLFPELRFWQIWTELTQVIISDCKFMMIGDGGIPVIETRRIWKVRTLSGRVLSAISKWQALNYPIQASCADLISKAMARLPEPARSCLINIIHDELLFEVPADQAEMVRLQAIDAMTAAGDEALGAYGLPIEIEATIGESWCHG